jgi:hypothetical protein
MLARKRLVGCGWRAVMRAFSWRRLLIARGAAAMLGTRQFAALRVPGCESVYSTVADADAQMTSEPAALGSAAPPVAAITAAAKALVRRWLLDLCGTLPLHR